jgi:hypothetical protein
MLREIIVKLSYLAKGEILKSLSAIENETFSHCHSEQIWKN